MDDFVEFDFCSADALQKDDIIYWAGNKEYDGQLVQIIGTEDAGIEIKINAYGFSEDENIEFSLNPDSIYDLYKLA